MVQVLRQPERGKGEGQGKGQAAGGLDKRHTPYGDWCPPAPVCGADGGQGPKPSLGFTSAFSLVKMTQQLATLAEARDHDPMFFDSAVRF